MGHFTLETSRVDGSIMMIVATDASLSDRNLTRLAGRALAGLACTGAAMSNGSGDYALAFSRVSAVRRTPECRQQLATLTELPNVRPPSKPPKKRFIIHCLRPRR